MKSNYKLLENLYTVVLALSIYYVVIMGAMYIAGLFIGTDSEWYNVRKIVGAIITLPVMYYIFYRPDKKIHPLEAREESIKSVLKGVVCVIVVAVFVSVAGSNVVLWMFPVKAGSGYQEASKSLSSGVVVFQFMNSALITPCLEELLYRGIVYKRLRRIMPEWIAIISSSLIFGLMHFNLQQFLFATLLGIAFACMMRISGHLYIAIIGHVAANVISICRNNYGILRFTQQKVWWAYVLAGLMLLVGTVIIYMYYRTEELRNEQ